jgi:hypothetical protein
LFSRYAIIDSSQHACSDAKKGELLIDFTHQLTAAGPDGRLKPHKKGLLQNGSFATDHFLCTGAMVE